jgi:hypothetical protein
MESIKIFIITQFIFLVFQFIQPFRLESVQYAELAFGSFFIILFFGLFGSVLTLDFVNPEPNVLNNSALVAVFFSIWYYFTKKWTNAINSDKNGVIYY